MKKRVVFDLHRCVVEVMVRMVLNKAAPDVRGWENFKTQSFLSGKCEWKIGTDHDDNLQAECWLVTPLTKKIVYSSRPGAVAFRKKNARRVHECLPVFLTMIANLYPRAIQRCAQ